MNNIEKIIDILLDDKDLNLSVDQCEQIAELLDDNGIGDLQKSKKEINSYAAVAAALEPTKWQLIAEDLEYKLEIAEEKLKQAQDIVKLNVLKPADNQEEKEVDTYEITTVLFDDFAAKNLDVVELLADAIDNKYPSMDQKYMIFGKYTNRGKNTKGEDNEV